MTDLILRAQAGDSEAMNKIINENVGLVWNVVRRFNNRGYDLEDLFQIGSMGFVKAIKKFSLEFNTKLSTYAVSMIIGEIKRFLRDDGMIKVSRSLKETSAKINDLKRQNPDKEYTLEELSMELGIDKEEIIISLDATSSVESLDKPLGEDIDSKTIGDNIPSNANEYEELMDKMVVNTLIDALDDNEKKIIIYRYYKGMTQGKIAEILGTSQVQVSRIEKKALLKMRALVN